MRRLYRYVPALVAILMLAGATAAQNRALFFLS